MKYHSLEIHEIAKIGQIEKYAIQMHGSENLRKIRLELRSLFVGKQGDSIFLLNIKHLQVIFQIRIIRCA